MGYNLTDNPKEVDRSALLTEMIGSLKTSGQLINMEKDGNRAVGLMMDRTGNAADDYDVYSWGMNKLLDIIYGASPPHECVVALDPTNQPEKIAFYIEDDSIDPEDVLDQVNFQYHRLRHASACMESDIRTPTDITGSGSYLL